MKTPSEPPGPPPPSDAPAQHVDRYLAWMAERGKPVKDTAREEVALRVGRWGFFEHGPAPGYPEDRVALDAAGHAVSSGDRSGSWQLLLGEPGLDAEGALARVAWLYRAATAPPDPSGSEGAPSLEQCPDGAIVVSGWLLFPPEMSHPIALRLTARAEGTEIDLTPVAGR